MYVPKGVEACWISLKPKKKTHNIENIVIASIYISPNSKYKTSTINHVIDTIHLLRSKYDNKVKYIIGGDTNRVSLQRILDAYGSLCQIISFATRRKSTLDNLVTD